MWSNSDKHFISGVRHDIDRALELATKPHTFTDMYVHEGMLSHIEASLAASLRVFGPAHPLTRDAQDALNALRWRIRASR